MPEELTALEKKIFEINVGRFSIYSFYLQSSYYINPRGNCIKEFYTLNQNVRQDFSDYILNNIDSEKAILTGIRKKYNSYAEKLLDSLEQETFVPHNLYFEDKQYRFDLKMVGFEAFPLSNPVNKDMPYSINLTFDLNSGWRDQSVKAKIKFDNKKKLLRQLAEDSNVGLGTTRRTLKNIRDGLEVLVERENDVLRKCTWQDTIRKLNLKDSTARRRCYTAKMLIKSGEIQKYFPQFS